MPFRIPRQVVEEVAPAPKPLQLLPDPADRRLIVVAQNRDGQGKTALANLIHLALQRSGLHPVLASVDIEMAGSAFPTKPVALDNIDVSIATDIETLDLHPQTLLAQYDPLLDILLDNRHAVIDLAARAVPSFFYFAHKLYLRRLRIQGHFSLVVPAVADPGALAAAASFVALASNRTDFPFSHRIAAVNHVHGDPRTLGAHWSMFADLCKAKRFPIVEVPKTDLRFNNEHGISFAEMFTMTQAEFIARAAPLHYADLVKSLSVFEHWARTVVARLASVSVLPAPEGSGWGPIVRNYDDTWKGPRD